MLLKERIVCAGVGQCGGNYVVELQKSNFKPYYINTSLEDLDTIQCDKKYKYHINGTKGMAKNRKLATDCILSDNNAFDVIYDLNDKYSMADIIIYHYSLGGGTGGTMGNFIAEVTAEEFPDKIINVVIVKGKDSEDVGLQANAIESLKHLLDLHERGIVNQIHFLDNNLRDDIYSINKDYAIAFDKFVSFDGINTQGNLDEEEKEKILTEPGMAVILEFENEDFANGLSIAKENTIYADWTKTPTLHGLILNSKQNKDINKELVQTVLGMPKFTHSSTWNNDCNILYASGMKFNENILNRMNMRAKELDDKRKQMEDESLKELEIKEEVAFDTTSVLNSGRNNRRRPTTNVIQQPTSSRRRGERNGASVLDKYKNM